MFTKAKRQLLPYLIVVLFGYIGFSLPLPILPEMFLDPARSVLPASYSIAKKTILLGLLMASYPLGQLFGAPLLGALSDRWGRKKVILYSLSGSTLGYLITAFAVSIHRIEGVFFGLLVCGFCEGNIAIAQAIIADLTQEDEVHQRTFHFGWINLFVCLGFIIGPLIGGKLADPESVSWFTFATPFWMAAIMTMLGIVIIAFGSKETKSFTLATRPPFLKSFVTVFKRPHFRKLYISNFFLALGFFSFFRFLPVYVEQMFNFKASMLAYVMVYDSLALAFALLFLIYPLSKYLTARKTTALFSTLMGLMFLVLVFPKSAFSLWFTIPPIGMFLAIAMTNGSVMISEAAEDHFQGQAMGALTSVQVSAEFLISIIGGLLATQIPALPLIVGAFMAFICSFILYTYRPSKISL